ncbi:MAG: hypothetical protein KQ78_00014 [Candidatus Izimaplasma bacterium HR2]|nr:MAG: hypothetical protein KQ78_00014 [Candidatus Izimaplasma bacterium HR2]
MSQKIKYILWYSIQNIFYGCMAYLGVMKGVVWASNIFMFISWVSLIIILLSLITVFMFNVLLKSNKVTFEIKHNYHKKVNSSNIFVIPQWFNVILDVAFISFLLYFGWFGYATIITISMIIMFTVKNMVKNIMINIKKSLDEQEIDDVIYSHDDEHVWDSEEDTDQTLRRMGVIE